MTPNGIIGAISFHSLEDRIVKKHLKRRCTSLFVSLKNEHKVRYMNLLTKKANHLFKQRVQKKNRRARSAKMRFAQKTESFEEL